MKEDRFDQLFRKELQKETKNIEVSDFLKTRIDMEITGREEKHTMKKNVKLKKYIAIAACFCLMIPAGIFASGKVASYISGTNSKDYATSQNWGDLSKLEKKVGIQPDTVKKFSNGYTFRQLETNSFDALDEEGNKMFTVKELVLSYENLNGKELDCYIHASDERIEEEARKADDSEQYNGITVNFYQDTYKFVPEDYQKTKEDQALEKKGKYIISYGNDKVELKNCENVIWEKDGISYTLMGFDTNLSSKDMMAMAGEMIQK